jgi:hypothetical protein
MCSSLAGRAFEWKRRSMRLLSPTATRATFLGGTDAVRR